MRLPAAYTQFAARQVYAHNYGCTPKPNAVHADLTKSGNQLGIDPLVFDCAERLLGLSESARLDCFDADIAALGSKDKDSRGAKNGRRGAAKPGEQLPAEGECAEQEEAEQAQSIKPKTKKEKRGAATGPEKKTND